MQLYTDANEQRDFCGSSRVYERVGFWIVATLRRIRSKIYDRVANSMTQCSGCTQVDLRLYICLYRCLSALRSRVYTYIYIKPMDNRSLDGDKRVFSHLSRFEKKRKQRITNRRDIILSRSNWNYTSSIRTMRAAENVYISIAQLFLSLHQWLMPAAVISTITRCSNVRIMRIYDSTLCSTAATVMRSESALIHTRTYTWYCNYILCTYICIYAHLVRAEFQRGGCTHQTNRLMPFVFDHCASFSPRI